MIDLEIIYEEIVAEIKNMSDDDFIKEIEDAGGIVTNKES